MPEREGREGRGIPDETISFSGRGIPPPTFTAPLPGPGGDRPSYVRRRALIGLLLLLLGLAGGFVISQFIGTDDEQLPGEDLVIYENASSTFPVDGAQFTRSTFDAQKKRCDKDLLKRLLLADRDHRFEAWLDLQEITEKNFDPFVQRLETRILAEPMPVTNYGCFPDGEGPCPFSIQSVLGPGTAVWFDPQQNRIVAKCTCSSPLRAPKCPPNCEEVPTPTPSPTSTPTPTASPAPTQAPAPPPTRAPTPEPTRAPTPKPSPSPTSSSNPTEPPIESLTPPPT